MPYRMYSIAVISVLIGSAVSQIQNSLASQQQSLSSEVLYPAAPLHYVNIGSNLAGDYTFGYDTGRGPMGQSFREEMRLADGTVKGTYGVIDENGHKRFVHYSSGTGNFNPEKDFKIPATTLSSIQRQPTLFLQRNLNSFSQQLPVFKPANYLQSRTSQPVSMELVPNVPKKEAVRAKKLKTTEKAIKSVTPVYKPSTPAENANVLSTVSQTPAPLYLERVTMAPTQTYSLPQTQKDSMAALAEMYKALKRVPKKTTVPTKQPRLQKVDHQVIEKSYDSKLDEDYYDSAPAFIDIERLSYNIGTDKSSSLSF